MKGRIHAPAESHYLETTPLAELMDMLGNTYGFRASAIIGDSGRLVYSKAIAPAHRHNLKKYYEQNTRHTGHSGNTSCGELSVKAGDDVLVMITSATNYLARIRIIVLISKQADKSLMQRYLRNLLPKIMRSVTWDPDHLVPLLMREGNGRQALTAPVTASVHHPRSISAEIDLSILDGHHYPHLERG